MRKWLLRSLICSCLLPQRLEPIAVAKSLLTHDRVTLRIRRSARRLRPALKLTGGEAWKHCPRSFRSCAGQDARFFNDFALTIVGSNPREVVCVGRGSTTVRFVGRIYM